MANCGHSTFGAVRTGFVFSHAFLFPSSISRPRGSDQSIRWADATMSYPNCDTCSSKEALERQPDCEDLVRHLRAAHLETSGWAMRVGMPASASRSANQPQPKVASETASTGFLTASPMALSSSSARVATRRLNRTSPLSSRAAACERFR